MEGGGGYLGSGSFGGVPTLKPWRRRNCTLEFLRRGWKVGDTSSNHVDERVGFGVLYRRGLVLTAVERDTIRMVTRALESWRFLAEELRC